MEKKLRPYHGLILFAVYLIFMPTIGALLQAKLGLIGSAIGELCLLVMAVLFPQMLGIELKSIFDITPPPVSKFFASLAFVGGTLLFSTAIDMVLAYLVPAAGASGDAVSALIRSSSPAVAIITVAILPAICEELLFRGTLLSSFRAKSPILTVTVVGLLFGIGHFDLYRLPSTALLGAAFATLVITTGSIFLPMLMHFIINTVSVVSAFTQTGEAAGSLAEYRPEAVFGSALVYLALGVLLAVIGSFAVRGIKLGLKRFLTVGTVSALLFLLGLFLTALGTDLTPLQALGTALFYGAIALTVLFIGSIIVSRKRPAKPLIAGFCALSILFCTAGMASMIFGAPPPTYSAAIRLNAKDTARIDTFTVTKEGEYLIAANGRSAGATLKISLIRLDAPLPEGESGAVTTDPTTSDSATESAPPESHFPVTLPLSAASDTAIADSTPPETAPTHPDDAVEGEYLATFEGDYIPYESKMLHLTPGTYAVKVTLTKKEGVKDSDIFGNAVVQINFFAQAVQ